MYVREGVCECESFTSAIKRHFNSYTMHHNFLVFMYINVNIFFFDMQRGLSIVPKSTNPKRILDNIDLFGWELSSKDMEALSHLEPQQKVVADMFCGVEGAPYKTKEELWDGEI